MDYANQNELNQVANSPLKFNSIISDSVDMECEKLKAVLSIDDAVVVEFNLKNGFYNLLDFLREVKINTIQYKYFCYNLISKRITKIYKIKYDKKIVKVSRKRHIIITKSSDKIYKKMIN